jgi:hypothetical protein
MRLMISGGKLLGKGSMNRVKSKNAAASKETACFFNQCRYLGAYGGAMARPRCDAVAAAFLGPEFCCLEATGGGIHSEPSSSCASFLVGIPNS